jgi:FkbM family methyltransferase
MKMVKRILLFLLGEKSYLRLLAGTFQKVYKLGLAGRDYQDIYFLKQVIAPGDYCADIGAHLGYYTMEMSRLVKQQGKVIAVEPMGKFNSTLNRLLEKNNCTNVELHKVAMGGDTDFVEMGIPEVSNMKKFAYARIIQNNNHLNFVESEKVKNTNGDELFYFLPRLDFIKCDVEGLELPLFSAMLKTLEKHQPVILCELADKKERIALSGVLQPIGYRAYRLVNEKLYRLNLTGDDPVISHNHYFLTGVHEKKFSKVIAPES